MLFYVKFINKIEQLKSTKRKTREEKDEEKNEEKEKEKKLALNRSSVMNLHQDFDPFDTLYP
jgi:hypothetical protein